MVHGKGDVLLEVFVNVLDNTTKYNVSDGRINIHVSRKTAETVVTEIRDTGIGIPEGDLAKVFDRFYRGGSIQFRTKRGRRVGTEYLRVFTMTHLY
ncbi:MAG: sensor histidine kinase [Syntrophales bacterium]